MPLESPVVEGRKNTEEIMATFFFNFDENSKSADQETQQTKTTPRNMKKTILYYIIIKLLWEEKS